MIDINATTIVQLEINDKIYALGAKRGDFRDDAQYLRAVTALCANLEHTLYLINKGLVPDKDMKSIGFVPKNKIP